MQDLAHFCQAVQYKRGQGTPPMSLVYLMWLIECIEAEEKGL